MNKQRLKINWKYTTIILQCTFCIMGQQLNYTSKLKNVKQKSRRNESLNSSLISQ